MTTTESKVAAPVGGVNVRDAMKLAAQELRAADLPDVAEYLDEARTAVEAMAEALEKVERMIRGTDAEFYATDMTAQTGLGEYLRKVSARYYGRTES